MPCVKCGSSTFRADRALAGRMVCSVCGLPVSSSLSFGKSNYRINKKSFNPIILYIILAILFFLVIIL